MVSNGNNETVTHYWLTYQWLCLNKDALDMTEFAAVYHIYLCPYGFPFIWFTISHKTTCTFYFNSPVCVCVVTIQRYSNPGNPGNPAILAVSYHYDQAVVIPLSAENLSHCQLSQCSGKKNTLEGEASLAIHGWKFQISSPPAAAAWRLWGNGIASMPAVRWQLV